MQAAPTIPSYHARTTEARPEKGKAGTIADAGLSGGVPSPSQGRGKQTLARLPDSAQGLAVAGSDSESEAAERLVLTSRQLLSPAVEDRRRGLLRTQRERWESRVELREAKLAALAALGEELRAGGCDATATQVEQAAFRVRRRYLYAVARVRALTRDLAPRVVVCGHRTRYVRCLCNGGQATPVPVGCRQRLACDHCRAMAAAKTRKRLLESIPWHRAANRDIRGRVAPMRMLTLTIAHSGDLERDRADIYRGWQALRKQMHRWYGRALPFSLVWEWTAGEDGLGHVHAHVLVIGGPRWWNYRAIRAVWRTACPRSQAPHIDWIRSEKGAAKYVSKYISKGTAIAAGMTEEVQAQTLAASYGKRSLWTSLRFWAPPDRKCRDCGERFHPTSQPANHVRVFGRRFAKLWCRTPVLLEESRDEYDRPVWYEPGSASITDMLRKLGVPKC